MHRAAFALFLFSFLAVNGWSRALADTYVITLDAQARTEPATGRVILFFITEKRPLWQRRDPIEGPFFDHPQPIASIAVKDFKSGESVTIDGAKPGGPVFPDSLDKLHGPVRVQAILDLDTTERSHEQGPGNVYSNVVKIELDRQRDDRIELKLTQVVEEPKLRDDFPNLKWVRLRSDLLSKFYGRDVYHRAGVAVPKKYLDPSHPRQQWPAIYVIPGFGGRHDGAENYALMHATIGIEDDAPVAVNIVLDPESPLGHHGFMDSPNHGPRGTALITELIPHLEKEFRLVAKPEARIITGHSSGGWSSLWLQLNHPDVFGACWSSAPDPIDFSAFQMTNLYEDANIYTSNGSDTPSYRQWVEYNRMAVKMTVRQEALMEHAIDPAGGSGQQWHAWEAMFSPRDDKTKMPKPMFDRSTGAIDKTVVTENWRRFDITRIVTSDWKKYGPIITQRVRLAVGDMDNYFLNRAVELFKSKTNALRNPRAGSSSSPVTPAEPKITGGEDAPARSADGYVLNVPDADHDSLVVKITLRWNQEMRAYLRAQGLHD